MDRKSYMNEYSKTTNGKKANLKNQWKRTGLLGDYDIIWNEYINTNNCNQCNCEFTQKNKKCMEHSHNTGEFRGIVCNSCNTNMIDVKRYSCNTSGIKNINVREGIWRYCKTYKKTNYTEYSKNKQLILWIKFTHYLKLYKIL
tara:strand:- start:3081 stop:3509 length:429 start_codon:yes stop_codon:yes gene_type:complete